MAISSISSKPISNAPRNSTVGLRIFGAIFAIFGVGFLIPMFVMPLFHVIAASGWHAVPGTIMHSEIVSHSSSKGGSTYSIKISFAYDFGATHYAGTRYDFSVGSSSGYDYRRAIVNRLHKGARTTCYVNPQQPSEAVIDRGVSRDMWFAGLPLLFVGVGVGIFLGAGKMARGRSPVIPATVGAMRHGGPTALREAQSPLTKLLVIGAIALFWNGIVSVFAYQAYFANHSGFEGHFLQIFCIPFLLVGAGLILGFFYQLLALSNPRPRIILANDALTLGQSSEVRWSFAGNYSRISHMTIFVEGREEATYSRGTQTATDTSIFARIRVADTTRQADIGAGRGIFMIPADTMHSFAAAHNKVIWSIVVHGEIARWPDVQSQFNLTVAPRPTPAVAVKKGVSA